MRIAFSSNAFRKYSIEEAIEIVARSGYDGIELMCDTPHLWPPEVTDKKIKSVKQALHENKLGISNLNAFMMCAIQDFHHPSWIEPDESYRRKRIAHTIACLRLAKALGAKNISTEPGGPLDGLPRSDALSIFKRGILEAVPPAEKLGVKILIEPEPELLIETSNQYHEFISTINSPAVGLNFDMGHFYCVGEDIPALIRKFGSDIAHFHLEDIAADRKHFHLPPGDGSLNYAEIFSAMRDINYAGWVTIELYPFQENASEIAKRALDYIKRYVK